MSPLQVGLVVSVLTLLAGHGTMSRVVEPESPILHMLSGLPETAEMQSFLKRKWIEFNVNDSGVLRTAENLRSSSRGSCTKDIWRLILSLDQLWALEFVDSFGKPESGLLTGKFTWTGNYEECVGAVAPPNNRSLGFKGQYCWVNIKPKLKAIPENMALKIGTCIPDSCNSERIMKHYYDLMNFLDKIPYVNRLIDNGTLAGISCVPSHVEWGTGAVACLFTCILMATVVVVATVLDYLQPTADKGRTRNLVKSGEENGTVHSATEENGVIRSGVSGNTEVEQHVDNINTRSVDDCDVLITPDREKSRDRFLSKSMDFLQCFSALRNGSAILDVSKKPGQLDCIHGIRFLSITWVILGHSFLFCLGQIGNLAKVKEILGLWHFQAVIQALFSVDTFFFLSGFLLAYLFLKDNAPTPRSIGGWAYFYGHRYIRLTPVYAIVLAFWSSTWYYFGEGPFWPYDAPQSDICKRNWWKNLLYVNNVGTLTDMCMGWSWYLSNDMQFFIISPLFLITLKRWPVVGYIVSGVTLVTSALATFFISYGNDLPVLFEGDFTNIDVTKDDNPTVQLFNLIYEKPYCRIGPYVIGILVAYIFLKTRRSKRAAHKCVVVFGWVGATSAAVSLIYGLYNVHLTTVESAFFNAFSRFAWAICLGWLVFACLSGYGGPVNSVLSVRYLFPLSRLTYTAYLIHPLIMYWYFYSLKDTFYVSLPHMALLYLAFLLLAFGFAFVVSLLFESPIVGLEKQLRKLLK